jgi:hypothetical protein
MAHPAGASRAHLGVVSLGRPAGVRQARPAGVSLGRPAGVSRGGLARGPGSRWVPPRRPMASPGGQGGRQLRDRVAGWALAIHLPAGAEDKAGLGHGPRCGWGR